LIFFRKKEKPIKKAAKEAEKQFRKISNLISKGKLKEAYSESLEIYRNLKSFPQSEIDECPEAINCIINYLYRLCSLARLLEKYDECINWGNEYFNETKRVYLRRGLSESEILEEHKANDMSWSVWFNMAIANFMKGNYVEAMNLISNYLGKSKKISVPDAIIQRFGRDISKVGRFIMEQQLVRFLIAAFAAGLIPKEYERFMLAIDRFLVEDLLRQAKEIISDKEKLEKVFEKYVEAGIPREAAEADVSAINVLVRTLLK